MENLMTTAFEMFGIISILVIMPFIVLTAISVIVGASRSDVAISLKRSLPSALYKYINRHILKAN